MASQSKGVFMQTSSESVLSSSVSVRQDAEFSKSGGSSAMPFDQYKVVRRNGSVVPFEPAKISVAMTKAFIAVNGGQGAASARVREMV